MITIDPVDDEVIRRDKIDRRQATKERRSDRSAAGAQANTADKKHSGILALLIALLRGKVNEDGRDD